MSYAADDTQAIAQRLKELQAERDQALTGTSAPVTGQESKTDNQAHSMYGQGYAGNYMGTPIYNVDDLG
jgi:hypothetical protein